VKHQSEALNEFAAAMAAAQAEMGPAIKDSLNANPNINKKYASLASVREACAPLARHGIAINQTFIRCEPTSVMERHEPRRDKDGKSYNVTLQVMVLGTVWTQLTHSSGQWVASELPVLADWSQIQDLGKVISYLRRYELAAIAGIAQEDDDGEQQGSQSPSVRQTDRRRPDDRGSDRAAPRNNHAPPRNGRELLDWAKAEGDPCMRWVRDWGRKEFGYKFLEWPDDAAKAGYEAWQDHLAHQADEAIDQAAGARQANQAPPPAQAPPPPPAQYPGSSGVALFTWAAKCPDRGMADAIVGTFKAKGWPSNLSEYSPEQAARGYAAGLARLEKIAEIAAKERQETHAREQAAATPAPAPASDERSRIAGWFPSGLPPAPTGQGGAPFDEFGAANGRT
jgi:hypothetical protein